jgi:riboflavin biosynthesis pyrimidine reductase
MRILSDDGGLPAAEAIARHVAVPADKSPDTALVRLNMIASADGAAEVSGRSGALGNHSDSLVFGALRAAADAVVVGIATAVSERYHAPTGADAQIYVVAKEPDVSGDPELFATGRATLVLPEDSGLDPGGVTTLRIGTGGRVDLTQLVAHLAGKVVMFEGGPSLAGAMTALGLVDEFFLTVAPRVISGSAARVVHGPSADITPWELAHVLADDDGFVFLRYRRP